MDIKQIQELVKLISKSNVGEIRIEEKDFKLTLKSKDYVSTKVKPEVTSLVVPSNQAIGIPKSESTPEAKTIKPENETKHEPEVQSSSEENALQEGFHMIKSPMIGTFYRSPAPEKDPYVKIGDTINPGDVVCTIEAMKLFNEIESEVSGKIVKVLVENASPVEYDQALFIVEPE